MNCYPAKTVYFYDMTALPKIPMLGPPRIRYVECIWLEGLTPHLDSPGRGYVCDEWQLI